MIVYASTCDGREALFARARSILIQCATASHRRILSKNSFKPKIGGFVLEKPTKELGDSAGSSGPEIIYMHSVFGDIGQLRMSPNIHSVIYRASNMGTNTR